MEKVVEAIPVQKAAPVVTWQSLAALCLAMAIDFTDAVPTELLFLIGLPPVAWVMSRAYRSSRQRTCRTSACRWSTGWP